MSGIDDDGETARGVVEAEVIDRAIRAALAERVRHMVPARVEKFDAGQQKADVKILVGDFHRDEEGALVTASVPIIPSVPVAFFTAGGFTFTVPIKEGETTGMLFFSDRSLDRWLSGQGQEVVDPEIYVRHALADGAFVPGLLAFGAAMSPGPPTDHATAGSVGGVRVHFRDGTITIGDESGSKKLVLDGDKLSASAELITWATQVEAGITGVGGVAPSPLFAAPAGPGAPDKLGTVAGSASQAKGK